MFLRKTYYFLFLSIAILSASTAFAQEEILEFTHSASHRIDFDAGFTLANEETGASAIFILDDRQIHAYGVNERFGMFRKIEVVKQKNMFDNILSKRVNGQFYTLFFHSSNYKKIAFFEFNFKKNTLTKDDLDLNLKGHRVLSTYQDSKDLKILTVEKKEPIIWVHTIDEDYKVSSEEFDLSNIELINYKGKTTAINTLIGSKSTKVSGIDMMNSGLPVSLAESSSKYKLYRSKGNIILGIDANTDYTQLVTLKLGEGNVSLKKYEKPKVNTGIFGNKTNSFVSGAYLAQIAVEDDVLNISIKNVATGDQLYSNTITKDLEVVSTINTPFVENKSWKDTNKVLSTKQFFRKILKDEISITMDFRENEYQITFGSWEKGTLNAGSSSGIMAGVGASFGMAGMILYLSIYQAVNPEFSSYASFSNGKQVRSEIILNSDFQHNKDGNQIVNIYDLMSSFVRKDDNLNNVMFTAFKGGGMLGVYNKEFKTIHMHWFK